MSDMLWIVPSRSRPDNIADLIATVHPTRCTTDLLVVVDDDDPELEGYHRIAANFNGFPWVRFVQDERLRLIGSLNKYAVQEAKHYDYIGFMGDDHRPRTPIWDGLMAAELRKMGTGLVYGNDLFQSENLPTQVCMTTDIISALGYMVPPTFQHLYADNFWLTLGKRIDRIRYMEQVVIEHMHPHAGKAEGDKQYDEVNSTYQHGRDKHAFDTYVRKGLDADLAKLKAIL